MTGPTPGKAASGATVAAAGGCKDGSVKNTAGNFCIKLPDGYKAGEVEERPNAQFPKMIRFSKGGDAGPTIVVSWGAPADQYDNVVVGLKAIGSARPNEKAIASGDLPAGGYYYEKDFGSGAGQSEFVVKGKSGLLKCYLNLDMKEMDAAVEACKTLASIE